MSDRQAAAPERRQHIRIAPKGTVTLSFGDHTHHGRISNLGRGGLRVATGVTVPSKLLGRSGEVALRLDGQGAEWLEASGRIVRIEPDGVALVFEQLPAPLVRLLDEMWSASRAHLRVLSAVLVDADPDRRAAMAEGFRAAGCRLVEASTTLEAIVRLGESSFEPDVIVIADSVPAAVADDLRSFVERNHPRAKLVTVGNESREPSEPAPAGSAHWISSTDPDSDLEARICQILGGPVRRRVRAL